MNIKNNLLSVASDIHNIIKGSAAVGGADSTDTDLLESGGKYTFNLHEEVSVPHDGRIHKTRPAGRITYKVSVEACWEPFD